jgi:hypothetical protein
MVEHLLAKMLLAYTEERLLKEVPQRRLYSLCALRRRLF